MMSLAILQKIKTQNLTKNNNIYIILMYIRFYGENNHIRKKDSSTTNKQPLYKKDLVQSIHTYISR